MRSTVTNGQPRAFGKAALVELLEMEIRSGRLSPGDKLPSERELSTEYSVSRSVIREALVQLAARGMIDSFPGRGSFVRTIDLGTASVALDTALRSHRPRVRDVIEARIALERETAALAARHATDEDLLQIEQALSTFDRAQDVVMRARADVEFHVAVAVASHNPVYQFMLASLSTLMFELALRSLSDEGVAAEAVPLHDAVFAAIRAGDAEGASQSMVDHLEVAVRHYGGDLDEHLDLVTQRRVRQLMHAANV